MTQGLTKSFVILIATLFFSFTLQASTPPQMAQKIGVSIKSQMLNTMGEFPVLVILKQQADLSFVNLNAPKEVRGQQVYDALRKTAMESQRELVSLLAKRGFEYQQFYILNMIALESATPELVSELTGRADVGKIINNPAIKNKFMPSNDIFNKFAQRKSESLTAVTEGNIVSTGAERVWQELGITGKNIVIAGQDTGIQWDHPALKTHYRGFSPNGVNHNYNWHDAIHKPLAAGTNPCGFNSKAPCDDHGHGTHTVGTIVGDDGATRKIGMAPGAQWMGCRNMERGVGRPTTYIECFQYFLAPYPQGGNPFTDGAPAKAPHVINNSWGCPPDEGCEGGEMLPVVEALNVAGLMVVVSAGNEGSGCSTIAAPPAHFTLATLAVGAHNHRNGRIAYFSSRGPSKFDGGIGPDITAPGVGIVSAIPGSSYSGATWDGTSMAGPHVVGLVALMWSAKPALIGNTTATSNVIRKTATPKTSTETCGGVTGDKIPNNTFGFGTINAYDAVKTLIQ
ncbi:MAG: S8 family serine peptidase [Oligoflexia bacterium]|nr:S8 family serine peptidase [Oligoflexia bacterium]